MAYHSFITTPLSQVYNGTIGILGVAITKSFNFGKSYIFGDLPEMAWHGFNREWILDECYRRMKESPNGIGQLVIGPYAIKSFQITTLAMGPVPTIASYGEDPVDTQAREPFAVMEAAIKRKTIVNLSADEALVERQKIKQHLGVTARTSAETLRFAKAQFENWNFAVDFETQISLICTNVIACSVFGLNPVTLEAIPVLKKMSEMIVHSTPGKADFERASADLLNLSKQLIDSSSSKIIRDKLYLYDQVADQELNNRSNTELLEILQETHGGGALIVESNLSALCAIALAKIFENPSIKEHLIQELNSVEVSNFEQLNKLNYLNAIYAETLRFVSPTSIIARGVGKHGVLSKVPGNDGVERDIPISKGTYLFGAIRHTHFDPEYWPNPEQFKPERFERTAPPRFSGPHFFPFAAGPRSCPAGGIFVNVAFKTLVAFVVQNYTLTLDKPMENIPSNALHPRWKNRYFITELNSCPETDQSKENIPLSFR